MTVGELDTAILARFTKFSHWFQRLTGRTNFFLARICLMVLALSVLVGIVNFWFPVLTHKTSSLSLFFNILWTVLISVDNKKIGEADDRAGVDDTPAKMIFFIRCPGFARVLFILFVFVGLAGTYGVLIDPKYKAVVRVFEILHNSFGAAIVCYYYLIDVTPLPPGKSKVRQWIEGLFSSLQPAEAIRQPADKASR